MSKKLINTPEGVVTEMIEGLLMTHPHLKRLDGMPDIKVIFDGHATKDRVAIISGGGSGHEPAHAGYVGSGMLSAAVCGDIFASPSAEAVLAAIKTVTGPAGCLLIVKNYTGDRLHFGLAAEQAKACGLKVEMVVVGEDVAIEAPGLAGRRGLAGTVLVHKAAGAAAAAGASLDQVVAVARHVASSMATLGVALRVCTLPGKPTSDRLPGDQIEIGLGIHGEPGTTKAPMMAAGPLVQRMMDQMVRGPFFKTAPGEHVALLINNLGGSTPMEMSVVARQALTYARSTLQLNVERIYVGPYMTALDMAGASITLLKTQAGTGAETAWPLAGKTLLELLDAATEAPGWSGKPAHIDNGKAPQPLPDLGHHKEASAADGSGAAPATPAGVALGAALRAACEVLVASEAELDALDAKVGDGDCGATLARGAQAVLQALGSNAYNLDHPARAMSQVAGSVRHAVGGSSGALYDIMITAAATALGESGSCGMADWARAFTAGVEAVQKYGGAAAGCRTMLDALLPAAAALTQAAQQGSTVSDAATSVSTAAAAGAEATKSMQALAGRASYVPAEVLGSVPDPGAQGAALWIKAASQALASSSR